VARGGRCTKEVEVAAREGRHMAIGVFSPPKSPSLYRRWGCTLPLPQGSPRAVAREERVVAARDGGTQPAPPNRNPGRPGPEA
jgi:hypothetical protein